MSVIALITRLAGELAAASSRRRVREIADAVLEAERGEVLADPEVRRAIDAVIDAAMKHAEVTERVAALSRRAHGEARSTRRRCP